MNFLTVALNHRVAKFILKDDDNDFGICPPQIISVLDLLIHLPHFYSILSGVNVEEVKIPEIASLGLIKELNIIFDQALTYGLESSIDVKPLFLMMKGCTGRNYLCEYFSPVTSAFRTKFFPLFLSSL